MNKILPFFCFMLLGTIINAQCDELFFSEYVEGYSNNKALEIYNPTSAAIDLSGYSIVRFSNGNTAAPSDKVIQLPNEMIEANGVYVIVIDLTDVADWDSQFDKPAWNGYNVIDTIYDDVTGEAVIDAETGEILVGPQYNDSGAAIFGDEYTEEYDLQCKADAFLCPEYEANNTMYFNGNDAMGLITGTVLANDASNLVDVIGVIGEDPEDWAESQDAWITVDGGWITKDKTIVRNSDVTAGRNNLNDVVAALGGSFVGAEWSIHAKNDFSYLGIHNSTCNTDATFDRFSCSTGPIATSVSSINLIDFRVYPNPNSTGSLDIEAEENITKVEIINMMGQLVVTEKYSQQNSAETINLNSVAKGIYVVKVHFSDKLISTQKLIVQ